MNFLARARSTGYNIGRTASYYRVHMMYVCCMFVHYNRYRYMPTPIMPMMYSVKSGVSNIYEQLMDTILTLTFLVVNIDKRRPDAVVESWKRFGSREVRLRVPVLASLPVGVAFEDSNSIVD